MDAKKSSETKWEKIGPFLGRTYAEMAGEILEKENVPFYISQDGVSNAYGIHGASLVGNTAFIYVPKASFEFAAKLLSGFLTDNERS